MSLWIRLCNHTYIHTYCAQHAHPCMYIHCCLAQWGIYWFSRVMHAAVRFSTYATYVVPGSVLPPVGITPLWPGTVRADSSRAHAPHSVAAPSRTHKTKSLRRHAHLPEPSRRSHSDSGDRELHRVAVIHGESNKGMASPTTTTTMAQTKPTTTQPRSHQAANERN